MAIGALASNLIGMVLGSVIQNSGDRQNENVLIQRTLTELKNKVKKSEKSSNSPKPLLSEFDDTNTM